MEFLEKLKGPMNAPALKIGLIICLSFMMAIRFFYVVMNYNREMMTWFLVEGTFLEHLDKLVEFILGAAFIIYAYRKNYLPVFYGLVLIYGLMVFQYLTAAFFGHQFGFYFGQLSISSGINFGVLITIAHTFTILFTPARSNKYLLFYAVAILVVTLVMGNLIRLEMFWFTQIIQMAMALIPVIFIFLVLDEFKKSSDKSAQDILDS